MLKTYTITTAGKSDGLTIPSGFEIRVSREIRRVDSKDNTKFEGVWCLETYEKTASEVRIINDAISQKKQPNYLIEITKTDLNSGTSTLCDKYVKVYLETLYPGKVT